MKGEWNCRQLVLTKILRYTCLPPNTKQSESSDTIPATNPCISRNAHCASASTKGERGRKHKVVQRSWTQTENNSGGPLGTPPASPGLSTKGIPKSTNISCSHRKKNGGPSHSPEAPRKKTRGALSHTLIKAHAKKHTNTQVHVCMQTYRRSNQHNHSLKQWHCK